MFVNHLRLLLGVYRSRPTALAVCAPSALAQAEFLADLIQTPQANEPVGSHRHGGRLQRVTASTTMATWTSIGTIKGTPTPANQVVLASADLVNPNLTNLVDGRCRRSERYSFSFDGNAQATGPRAGQRAGAAEPLTALHCRRGRMDADFPEVLPQRSEPPGAAVGSRSAGRVLCLAGRRLHGRRRERRRRHPTIDHRGRPSSSPGTHTPAKLPSREPPVTNRVTANGDGGDQRAAMLECLTELRLRAVNAETAAAAHVVHGTDGSCLTGVVVDPDVNSRRQPTSKWRAFVRLDDRTALDLPVLDATQSLPVDKRRE